MNDEKIGAFMDREGEEDARAALAKDLETNAGGTLRLGVFKRADELLRRALPPSASASDHALSQRILNAEPIRPPTPLRVARLVTPLAAACVFGVFLGSITADRAPRPSLTRLDGDMAVALELVRSGEAREIPGGQMTLALTVQTESGVICRQFRLATTQEATDALACRSGMGWNVVAATAAPHANNAYHLAEGGGGVLDTALGALGGGSVLDESEEDALLRNHWQIAAVDARSAE